MDGSPIRREPGLGIANRILIVSPTPQAIPVTEIKRRAELLLQFHLRLSNERDTNGADIPIALLPPVMGSSLARAA
jgi:hypothetical protein